MVLIFGIVGLVMTLTCACGPLGIVAWIMGNSDLKAMREGRMDRSGEGITRGGQICGIIATVIWTLIILIYAGFFGLMLLVGATGSSSSGITPTQ
jgi:K+ transporter